MKILGIESSCDEIAGAIVEDGYGVLSTVIESSAELHKKTKGIVPEIAAREGALKIAPVISSALIEAKCIWNDIDAIAVTNGPGLLGSLLVGIESAKTLAMIHDKPLVPVFHIAGHILSNLLEREEDPHFPVVSLTVAGGHNDIYLWNKNWEFRHLGETVDDAAGEAFDKGARMLGLPYPGGPALSKLADKGKRKAVAFPRPMEKSGDFNFSFSGLKTALYYKVKELGVGSEESKDMKSSQFPVPSSQLADFAASYQEAIVDTLVMKLFTAVDEYGAKEVHLAGGVSANERLRERFGEEAKKRNLKTRIPEKREYCTDNAAMIACAGYYMWQHASSARRKNFIFQNVDVDLSHEFRF